MVDQPDPKTEPNQSTPSNRIQSFEAFERFETGSLAIGVGLIGLATEKLDGQRSRLFESTCERICR
jgi:hypothetical protein